MAEDTEDTEGTEEPTGAHRRLQEARRRAQSALVTPAAPRPPVPPTGRAGRNLPAAVAVGLGLLAVVGLCLFVRQEAFVVLAVLATSGALWELARAVGQRGIRVPLVPLWVGGAGILVAAYVAGSEAMLAAFVLTAGGVVLWRVLAGGGLVAVRDATAGLFCAAYVSLLAGFAMLLLAMEEGSWLVLAFVLVVIANDVGGYVAGVLLGRTPLAPTISPKKSWEGLGGSLVLAGAVGAGMLHWFVPGGQWWGGVLLGLAAVLTATTGDLAESLLKRDLGLKDMGSLLPGHGGIMDRLDSLLITAPVSYVVLRLITGQ